MEKYYKIIDQDHQSKIIIHAFRIAHCTSVDDKALNRLPWYTKTRTWCLAGVTVWEMWEFPCRVFRLPQRYKELCRCKCSLTKNQVVRVYCKIMHQNYMGPGTLTHKVLHFLTLFNKAAFVTYLTKEVVANPARIRVTWCCIWYL